MSHPQAINNRMTHHLALHIAHHQVAAAAVTKMGNFLDILCFWLHFTPPSSPQGHNIRPRVSINCACFHSNVNDDDDEEASSYHSANNQDILQCK